MDLDALQAAGLYDPASPGAADRLALLQLLVAEGCTVEEMVEADARGRLFALGGDRQVRSGPQRHSLADAAARLGLPTAEVLHAWHALGLTVPAVDTVALSDADVEALRTWADVRQMIGHDQANGLLRVMGASLARLAEAESSAMRSGIAGSRLSETGSEAETGRVFTAVAAFVPRLGAALDAVHRQHLEAARVHFEHGEAPASDRLRLRLGVGFADLSGFTDLARGLSVGELSRVLATFADTANEVVHAEGGRVVKLIGDAVMWVSHDVEALTGTALRLVHSPVARAAGLQVRAGVALGEVLAQDGDYFGTPVNLAARLVAAALPGQVLAAADAVEGLPDGRVRPLPAVPLRGFPDPVPLFLVEPRSDA